MAFAYLINLQFSMELILSIVSYHKDRDRLDFRRKSAYCIAGNSDQM